MSPRSSSARPARPRHATTGLPLFQTHHGGGGVVARGSKAHPAGGVDARALFGGGDENLFGVEGAFLVPGNVLEP